jgi:hypothetical protein
VAVVTIVVLLVVGALMWGLSAEKAKRRRPPDTATPEQLAAVKELRDGGYDVEWLEDGTAHLYAPTRKSLHVSTGGHVMFRNPKHRRRR